MNQITKYLLGIIIVSLTISCRKDNNLSDTDNIPGLPPVTQIGANTFGCLVNGKPWVPSGNNGTANLSIDYDLGFNNGIFDIVAYRFIFPNDEQLIIGIRDSLKFITVPITLNLSRNSLFSFSFKNQCDYWNQFSEVYSKGSLSITKLDKTNKIISGKFNASMFKPGCDTINITNGRFDMKF